MTQVLRVKCHSMSPKQRRQIIAKQILYKTTQQIAKQCGVCKRTILRDIKTWKQEGGFEELLLDEFIQSYPTIKKAFPEKAFDRLCYLLGKTMTQRRELKEETSLNIQEKVLHLHMWKPEPSADA